MAENIRPYIIINGKSSRDVSGLMIVSLPPISKPQMRVSAEEIDGRDGDIVTELGFSAYDKPVEIGLAGDYDVDEVISFFNQAGIIIFSNEPDKYYKFAQYNGIDFEKLIKFKTATVIFHVQPFKYATESNDLVVYSPTNFSVTNEGNIYSRPELAIQGSGDVSISVNGSEVLDIAFGEAKQPIIIDSDGMNAYGTKSNIKELITEVNAVLNTNGYDYVWVGGAGKNKAHVTATSQTINGIAYAVESDGTISATGTASGASILDCGQITLESGKSYILSGCASGGSGSTYCLFLRGSGSFTQKIDFGSGISFTMSETITTTLSVIVYNGTTVNNLVFKPMVRLSSETDASFEPYENIGEITGWEECDVVVADENMQEVSRTSIALGDDTVYGGTLNVTTGLLTIDSKHIDLSSITDWNVDFALERIYKIVNDAKPQPTSIVPEKLKCNRFEPVSITDILTNKKQGIGISNGKALQLHIDGLTNVESTTLQNVIDYFNANKTYVVYELENPVEIQLTAEEIMTIIGENNIYCNTGAISECIYTKDGVDITTSGQIVTFDVDAFDLNDSILKNRLVKGNYDNLRLKAGTNQIRISGDVDVIVLSNFSRWL